MPTETINTLHRVQHATGTDFAVDEALAELPPAPGLLEAVRALPGVSRVEGSVYDVRYTVD
jgi:hypothetical protein